MRPGQGRTDSVAPDPCHELTMWTELLTAVALVLVIEGLLPFVSPEGFRHAMRQAIALPDRQLRIVGVVSMVTGLILLYAIR